MKQIHDGEGDNVGGNKIINIVLNLPPKFYFGFVLIVSLLYLSINHIIKKSEPKTQEITITGQDGQKIPNATIKVVSEDSVILNEEITPNDGGKVEVDVPNQGFFERDDVYYYEVEFGGETFKFDSKSVKLAKNNQINLTIDTSLSPYSVKYYNLNSLAVDFILEGEVTDGINTSIDNNGILYNEAFKNLKELKNNFSINADFDAFDKYQETPINSDIRSPKKNRQEFTDIYTNLPSSWYLPGHQSLVLYGTGYLDGFYSSSVEQIIFDAMPFDSMLTLLDMYSDWVYSTKGDLSLNRQNIESMDTRVSAAKKGLFRIARKRASIDDIIKIRQRLNISDREKFGDVPLKLLDYCIDKKFPKGFLIFELLFNAVSGCTDYAEGVDYFYTKLNIYLPRIKFHIAVIENIKSEPIVLSNIDVKYNVETNIRTVDYDLNYFEQKNSEKITLNTTLKPSEKFIIPLYCYFDHFYDTDGFGGENFVIGPSYQLVTAGRGKYNYPIASFDPSSIYIYGSFEGSGSCPYAYTYSDNQNIWILEDHILLGVDNYFKKSYDTINISRFNGEILIKELDPETSYIDFIEIRCRKKESDLYKSFFPSNSLLSEVDNVELIMNQGDSIILNFPKWKNEGFVEFQLISNGYYERYSKY